MRGHIHVPGDKSVSHRSVIFGSLATGVTEVTGFLEGEDSLNTLAAFRAMGVAIEHQPGGQLQIQGRGLDGLQAPSKALYLGNSGTAMRLMAGVLAGRSFDSTLTGDASLNGRPMGRVIEPLQQMGALIEGTDRGTPPLHIRAASDLQAIHYQCPMASAQLKSCLLLAGLGARGETCIVEPAVTRDHTERMLRGFGVDVSTQTHADGTVEVRVEGGQQLQATRVQVPGDISSSAFFLVAASIAPNSDLTVADVGLNPTRTGIIDILRLMGANIEIGNERVIGGEPIGDLRIRSAELRGIQVPPELVSLAIDEFPVLFVAAAVADGETVVTGAEELRVKETDRIQVMADGLQALGADITPTPDGAIIRGGELRGGTVDSCGDHRTAMSFAIAALRAQQEIVVLDCDNVKTSFPNFQALAANCGLAISSGSV